MLDLLECIQNAWNIWRLEMMAPLRLDTRMNAEEPWQLTILVIGLLEYGVTVDNLYLMPDGVDGGMQGTARVIVQLTLKNWSGMATEWQTFLNSRFGERVAS